MPTKFTGGPADGKRLSLSRAPYFLRVAECRGEIDALDKLDDKPTAAENLWVYVLNKNSGGAFIDGHDPKTGKRWGRFETMAEYVLWNTQPSDETMRDSIAWQQWCQSQPGPHHVKE